MYMYNSTSPMRDNNWKRYMKLHNHCSSSRFKDVLATITVSLKILKLKPCLALPWWSCQKLIFKFSFWPSLFRAEQGCCVFLMDVDFILQNIVLSGCPQITTAFLYISVLPTDLDVSFKRRIVSSYTQVDHQSFILYDELEKAAKTLLFRNVHMVDLSKCPNVHFGAAIDWLKLAFPELRIFRALHCLSFHFDDLIYLLLRCPWIDEIDMTVDTSTITPNQSIVSSSSEVLGKVKQNRRRYYTPCPPYDRQLNSVFSNVSRVTLEGRNDIDGN